MKFNDKSQGQSGWGDEDVQVALWELERVKNRQKFMQWRLDEIKQAAQKKVKGEVIAK